jgi:hypothetical protein
MLNEFPKACFIFDEIHGYKPHLMFLIFLDNHLIISVINYIYHDRVLVK